MTRVPHCAALTLLVCTACAPRAATVPQPVDPAHQHHEMALPATAGPGYTAADVQFMQHMIGHHAQAIVMARLAVTHGAGPDVSRLAQKIEISQRDEIDFMETWLRERGQAVPDSAQAHGMQMPGMLSGVQLAQLNAARGVEFDRLFLSFMIQHHEGALTMVDALFASRGAAQEPDIFRFATDVVTDQTDEIDVMKYLLASLSPNRESTNR